MNKKGANKKESVILLKLVAAFLIAIIFLSIVSYAKIIGEESSSFKTLVTTAPKGRTQAQTTAQSAVNTGHEDWYFYLAGIINLANGNLYLSDEDWVIAYIGDSQIKHKVIMFRETFDDVKNIKFTRSYNSLNKDTDGPLGLGWTHNYNARMVDLGTTVEYYDEDGSKHVFSSIGGGLYSAPAGIHSRLRKTGSFYALDRKDGSIMFFDSAGKVINITDKNGLAIRFVYDGPGRLSSVQRSDDVPLTFDYNPAGRISQISDSIGRTTLYTYNPSGHLIEVTDRLGNKTKYSYNATSNALTDVTDRVNVAQNFKYKDNKVKEVLLSLYNTSTGNFSKSIRMYSIEYGKNIASVTGPRRETTTVLFNDAGNPIKVIDALGGVVRMRWDADNNMISYINQNGNMHVYGYDLLGNFLNVTDPLGNKFAYNWTNINTSTKYISLLSGFTNGNGVSAKLIYDTTGNLIQLDLPMSYNITYQYDILGNIKQIRNPREYTETFSYENTSRILNITDALGNKTIYRYDPIGRLIQKTTPRGYITTYVYDNNDRLIREIDALGAVKEYKYNAQGSKIEQKDELGRVEQTTHNLLDTADSVVDASGNKTSYSYDTDRNLVKKIDENGNPTKYEYDTLDRLTKTTDALGNSEAFSYDAVGNILTKTDKLGRTTRFEYDALNRVIKKIDPLGNTEIAVYDFAGNVINSSDKNNRTTIYFYDALNRPIQIIDSLGNSEFLSFDGNGNQINYTDKNGNVELYEYDALDRISSIVDALGNVVRYGYDADSNMASSTDARNYTTAMFYDGLNRLIRVTDALGNSVLVGYDAAGNIINTTNKRGYTTFYEYDALDRLTKTTDALGGLRAFSYDAAGNILSVTDQNGNTMTFEYDALTRPIKEYNALGQLTVYGYDAAGNLVNRTDANGNVSFFYYDSLNRLIREIKPFNLETTNYLYDGVGNIISLSDGNNGTTTYTYDGVDRLTFVSSPLGNVISYLYDKNGNLIRRKDPTNRTTTYSYDAINQRINITYVGFGDVRFTYDANGNLLSKQNIGIGLNDTTTYTYDPLNNIDYMAKDYASFFKTIDYGYDAEQNRVNISYPDGTTITYFYDALNRPMSISDTSDVAPTIISYDPGSRRTHLVLPNGVETSYTYDNADRLLSIVNKEFDTTLISSYNYTYDGVGNKLSLTDKDGGLTSYNYDGANRLIRVINPDTTYIAWTYDAAGNRLGQDNNGIVNVYTYDQDNRLLSAVTPSETLTYSYDHSGNLISKADSLGTTTYTYDFENRLVKAIAPASEQVEYLYSTDGDRLAKLKPSLAEYYFYDGDNLILTHNGSDNVLKRYVYSRNVDEPISLTQEGNFFYYLYDGIFSVTSLTNATQDVVASYKYNPFGEIISETSLGITNPFKFTAREHDSETGLYYYRARYYSPSVGRFISKDPLPLKYPMTWSRDSNLYVYVQNNPLKFIDPSGMSSHGVYVAGKWYYPDEYDMSSVKKAEEIENQGYEEANKFIDELNKKRKEMQKEKDKIEEALDKKWYELAFNIAGLVVTIAGVFTANPFLTALGISLTLHKNIMLGASGGDWAKDGVKTASNEGGQAISDSVGEVAGKAFRQLSGIFNTMLDALDTASNMEKIGNLEGTLEGLRLADRIHDDAARRGVFSEAAQAMVDVATAQARDLAESDKRKDTPTEPGGGGRPQNPTGPQDTPTSRGGDSTGGVSNPGADVETPGHVDPPGVGIPIDVRVINTGYENLFNITVDVVAYNTNANGSILLVIDESDGANFWYEQALNDTGHAYDKVYVDTQYSPVYADDNASTKDLKDYDVVLWEASNDRIGTLQPPAQAELEEYLNNSGCLFVGGEGIMYEWPQKNGTLMSDYMFANGFEADTFEYNITGVPSTIGDGLFLNLKGGDGSSFENFSSSILNVKLPGVANFLYGGGIAGIQGENKTVNGSYKVVLFSYDFDSIDNRGNRTLVMNRTLEFLNCENGEGGPGGVPTSQPPSFPDDPPDSGSPGIPVVVFPTQTTTVVINPRATTADGTVVVGGASTTTIEVKPEVSVIQDWDFDSPTGCIDEGWTHEDLTAQPPFCHIDTYNALSGNSWWCGANNPAWVTPPGYGNNWKQTLTIPPVDVSSATQPVISFYTRYDIGPGDVMFLEIFDPNTRNWIPRAQFIGQNPNFPSYFPMQSPPIDKNIFGNMINLRFHLLTDASMSDEDGLYNSDGAFFVDNIAIFDAANPLNQLYYNDGGDSHGIGAPPVAAGEGTGDFWNLYAPGDSRVPTSPSCQFAAIDPVIGVLPDNLFNPLVSPVTSTSSLPPCTLDTHLFLTYDAFVDIPFSSQDTYSIEMSSDVNPTWTVVRENMKGQLGRVTLAEDLGPVVVNNAHINEVQVRFNMKTGLAAPHGVGLVLDNARLSCAAQPGTPTEAEPLPKGGGGSSPIFKKQEISEPI